MVFSKKEAAARLGVSVKTLERKTFDGSISFHKIGNRIIFDQNDLDAFWDNCRHPAKKQLCETTGGAA